MPNPNINRRVTLSGVFQYDSDALAYFAQLSPEPSEAYKLAINTLILQLKSDGNWTPLDRLWIFATEYVQNARVSVKNPTSTIITIGGSAFTANQGFTPDGASNFLNTNFTPSTDAVQATQNSTSFGAYLRTNGAAANVIDYGVFNVNNSALYAKWGDAKLYSNVNDGGAGSVVTATSAVGFTATARINAATTQFWRNGTSLGTAATASTGVPALPIYISALNNAGVAAFFSNRQISIAFHGSSSITQSTFYTALQTFATTRGFNV